MVSLNHKKVQVKSGKKDGIVLQLPAIPDKLYFTIGEVSKLCLLKPHVVRYWEQEFPKLDPVKRKGNRRYYRKSDVLLIRRIKQLLYAEGFTIDGARAKLLTDDGVAVVVNTSKNDCYELIQDLISSVENVLRELEGANSGRGADW